MSIRMQIYGLETLTVEDRLALAEALWNSVSEIIDERRFRRTSLWN